jgi:hypothetical protein
MFVNMMQTLALPAFSETWTYAGRDENMYRLLHDFELPADLVKDRPGDGEQGYPETVRLTVLGDEVVPFTDDLQWWWYFNLNPGLAPGNFAAIIDTWTPGADGSMKVRTCANYVTMERLDLDPPKLPLFFAFGGNMVHAIGEETRNGVAFLEIEALEIGNLPPVVYHEIDRHLFHHLTIIKGTQVNPFHYNGGRAAPPYLPCYTAIVKAPGSRVLVEKRRAVKLESLLKPNPYIPVWYYEKM